MNRNVNQQYQQQYQQQQPSYAYARPVKKSNSSKIKKDCGCNKGGYRR